jgi:hypothetical protein
LKKKLNLALPAFGNYLSTSELFDHKSLHQTKWKDVKFDIFTLHNRWNKKEVMTLLQEAVPTFTIIRDPVQVFDSLFHYHDEFREFYAVKDIHEMVLMMQNTTSPNLFRERYMGIFGRNQLSWDMGISPDLFDNMTAMRKEIERLDREFDLVMIADRLDESLILLNELLNWPLKNVVHLNLNRRKPEKLTFLSKIEKKVISNWLAADIQIFDHFSQRFNEKLSEINRKHFRSQFFQGVILDKPYVKVQTQLLKEANMQLYDMCVLKEDGNERLTGQFKENNDNIIGYIIKE